MFEQKKDGLGFPPQLQLNLTGKPEDLKHLYMRVKLAAHYLSTIPIKLYDLSGKEVVETYGFLNLFADGVRNLLPEEAAPLADSK